MREIRALWPLNARLPGNSSRRCEESRVTTTGAVAKGHLHDIFGLVGIASKGGPARMYKATRSDCMLRRITFDRYEADLGDQIEIVAQSRSNNGVNDARFEYASKVLPRLAIQGLPGATFTVLPGRNRVQAVVAFDPGASVAARYDLFELDSAGGLTDLRQHVSKIDSAPLVGFAVEGVPVAAAVTRGMPTARRNVPPPPAPPPQKKAVARKKTKHRAPAAKKKATRKRAAPKSAARK